MAVGATMVAPAILFSGLIGVFVAVAPMFWEIRTAHIKTGKFRVDFVIDPSGYVYDAVSMELLDGVKTTAYYIPYDESEDFWYNTPSPDVYGTLWDAAEYDQANPIYTNPDGKYAWDVPEGWWRVKYEKEGYETTWSEWLPVPPPQTDVNIAMTPITEATIFAELSEGKYHLELVVEGVADANEILRIAVWSQSLGKDASVVWFDAIKNTEKEGMWTAVIPLCQFSIDDNFIIEAYQLVDNEEKFIGQTIISAPKVEHVYDDMYDLICNNCGHERLIPSVPMFRMYDPNSGEHFYTGSEKERDFLVNAGWNYEGVAFNFPVIGEPVYRLYNPVSGDHLYTMDLYERAKLLEEGWNDEGVAFNSATPDCVPQYRLWNPNAVRGAWHFTGSERERDFLLGLGWQYQGIGWYSMIE